MVFLALESAFFALTVYKSDREDLGKMANFNWVRRSLIGRAHLKKSHNNCIPRDDYETLCQFAIYSYIRCYLPSSIWSPTHLLIFFSSYFLLLLCSWNEMDKYFPWAFLVLVFYGHLHFVIVMSTSQYVTKVWRHYENIGFSSNFLAFAFSNSFAKLKSLHTMISVLIFYYLLLTNQLPYPKQQRKKPVRLTRAIKFC